MFKWLFEKEDYNRKPKDLINHKDPFACQEIIQKEKVHVYQEKVRSCDFIPCSGITIKIGNEYHL